MSNKKAAEVKKFMALVENKNKTYVMTLSCFNCGAPTVHTIPFGTPVQEFNPQCSKCGVRQSQLNLNGPLR